MVGKNFTRIQAERKESNDPSRKGNEVGKGPGIEK